MSINSQTFAQRLAAQIAAPAAVSYGYGAPVKADPFAHVAGRGHTTTQAKGVFK